MVGGLAKGKLMKTENLTQIIDQIRLGTSYLKVQKRKIAKKCLNKMERGTNSILDEVLITSEIVSIVAKVMELDQRAMKDPDFRAQAETLVANVVQDIANRFNEWANMIEAIGVRPEYQKDLQQLIDRVNYIPVLLERREKNIMLRKLEALNQELSELQELQKEEMESADQDSELRSAYCDEIMDIEKEIRDLKERIDIIDAAE